MQAEQFVGQELVAYSSPWEADSLYFWMREQKSSTAEVDFVKTCHTHIIPIEVKAGKTGRLKSLHMFLAEKKLPYGIRLSQAPLAVINNIISLPLYMVGEIDRIIKSTL